MPFSFDGASLGLRVIKQINIWHTQAAGIQDISIVYTDGGVAGPYGFGRTNQNQPYDSFVLAQGEFITECFVWYTSSLICSLQFVKNTTQISAFYGFQSSVGDPTIFNAGGNALLGISGNCNAQNIIQAQPVWRRDVRVDAYRAIATATIGVANTYLFNDFQYLGNPANSRISKMRYRNTASVVAGLQITYSCKLDGRSSGAAVYLLEFVTNKENTKKFGQEAGEAFSLVPPKKDMVLYYLLGKSAGYIQSLTFVWGAPPL
ncbi:hypothetical protein B0J17DRAFT_154231 [Rhizoctonia solani]|nr:hypothetical protein B0J17DRAFT_154231 [Rhizoctonia solani]